MQMNTIGAAIQQGVSASDALQRYAMDIWTATSDPVKYGLQIDGVDMSRLILAGASPRGMGMLMRAARVVAWMADRDYLTPEDIRAVLPSTLVHRVFFTPVYEMRRSELADALVSQMLERVATP
jgi:MoxR-like ATPase